MTRARISALIAGAVIASSPATAAEIPAPETDTRLFASPFLDETKDPQYASVAAIMGTMIAEMLGRQPGLVIVERQAFAQLKKEQRLQLTGLTADQASVASARLLHADYVLTGRLFLTGTKLTIRAKVIELKSEALVASAELATRPEELIEAALQLSRKLAPSLSVPPPEIDLTQIDKTPLASLHFGKGLSYYMTGNLDAALMHWMRTIDFDPDFIDAHYYAALAYLQLKEDRHAIIELRKFLKRPLGSEYQEEGRKLLTRILARGSAESPPGYRPQPAPEKESKHAP